MRRASMCFAISLSIEPGLGHHSGKQMSPVTSLIIAGRISSNSFLTSDSTLGAFGTEGPGRDSIILENLPRAEI